MNDNDEHTEPIWTCESCRLGIISTVTFIVVGLILTFFVI